MKIKGQVLLRPITPNESKIYKIEREITNLLRKDSFNVEVKEFILSMELHNTTVSYDSHNEIPIIGFPLEPTSLVRIRSKLQYFPPEASAMSTSTYVEQVFTRFISDNKMTGTQADRYDMQAHRQTRVPEMERIPTTSPFGSVRSAAKSATRSILSAFDRKPKDDDDMVSEPDYDKPRPIVPAKYQNSNKTRHINKAERIRQQQDMWDQHFQQGRYAPDDQHEESSSDEEPEAEPEQEQPTGKHPAKDDDVKDESDKQQHTSSTDSPPNDAPTKQKGMESYYLKYLLKRATKKIVQYRSDPKAKRFAEHLKRFNDAGIEPHKLTRNDIKSNDIVIYAVDSEQSKRYILTFGGADLRPIFNPVEDNTWNKTM